MWWAGGISMNLNLHLNLRDIIRWLTNFLMFVVGAILTLRFFLRLFDAEVTNEFVNWVYETSGEIMSPFRNMFFEADIGGAIIDFSALFAFVVYGVFAMAVLYWVKRLT